MNLKSIYLINYKLINGLIFGLTLLLLAILNPVVAFRYDSRLYWELTHSLDSEGVFHLLNFKEALRGVIFSLLLYPSLKISEVFHWNEILTCRLYLIIIYSCCFAWMLPIAFKLFIGKELNAIKHGILGMLLLLFWWEYFTLPLTDMAGMILLFAAFFLLLKKHWFYFLLSGFCLYAAVNMRLIYVLAIPFYIIYVFISLQNIKNILTTIAITFIGFAFAVIPQWYINHYNFATNTWLVPTQASEATGGKSLLLMQLNWGLSIQKYETNIDTIYPTPEVKYLDRSGVKLSEIHGNKDFISISEYFNFVMHHPSIFKVYLKHLFNGFDVTTPKAYLTGDIYYRSLLLRLINFTVIFSGLYVLFFYWKELGKRNLLLLLMIAIIISSVVPMAIEVRFFIPAQILIYLLAINFFDKLMPITKKRAFMILVLYLCFIGSALYLNISTANQIEFLN